jgi:hypothetical protein
MSITIDGEAGTFTKDTNDIKLSDDALTIPSGNTAQRPQSPILGMIRFNTETANAEGYMGTEWVNIEA